MRFIKRIIIFQIHHDVQCALLQDKSEDTERGIQNPQIKKRQTTQWPK